MAYRIEYKQGVARRTAIVHKTPKIGKIVIAVITALCLLFWCINIDAFVPGNPAVTKVAASELLTDVRQGRQIVDALAAFCRKIIMGADIPYAH